MSEPQEQTEDEPEEEDVSMAEDALARDWGLKL